MYFVRPGRKRFNFTRCPSRSHSEDFFALRSRSRSDVPILILSALGAPGSVAKALDAGADDYLIKPVHASLLASRLRTLVRRQSLHREDQAA